MIDFLFRNKNNLKGTEDVSMLVDIQNAYLPPERSGQCKEYIFSRRRLVKILLEDIEMNMDEGNDIILVEFNLVPGTIREIKEKVKKYPQIITIKKDSDGLLRSTSKVKKRALKLLEPVKKSKINIKGISVSCCVRQTGSSLLDQGFNPKVEVNKSMNVIGIDVEYVGSYTKRNTVGFIRETYEEDYPSIEESWYKRDISHILDFGSNLTNGGQYVWEL